ncbi:pyrroloquinoline quinone precursor peptide PqqA [Methylocystis echinoides]|uniref:Coenzyme PQQ synthesis protein A n=1 Tax=Methylocystis echinoides TaxID=29468 RepID=A0A9W6GVD5_9HYPH|nr:pyrroloquinoline quinone precursor peptide PqqA [Methylocystis echinoides]GLI93762.1 hypothetical protein LMG27198_27540 [Methylocystis echinoides]
MDLAAALTSCEELKPLFKIKEKSAMSWSTPILSEVCLGMEITSYESAEI